MKTEEERGFSYNSDDDGDHYEPVEPEVPVLRPEAGAYVRSLSILGEDVYETA